MISRFIQTEVKVICRSEAKLRQITLTEVWINLDTMRKPNSTIVLLYNSEIIANLDEDAITVPTECGLVNCNTTGMLTQYKSAVNG